MPNPSIDRLVNVGTAQGSPSDARSSVWKGRHTVCWWPLARGGAAVVVAGVATRHRGPGEP
jgi:hypothetical protein